MNRDDLCYLPATEMAKRIRAKKLSPVEIVKAVLERIDEVNPKVNCYCVVLHDEALAQAKKAERDLMKKKSGAALGLLHGVPFSVKDIILTKGVRTMRGSKIYENYVPTENAPIVERLLAAGGIMLGKTTTPEFGWKGITDSPVTGITRNPWDLSKTPGGSSGGASAQVAAGLGPLAIGTDGGGSIRIPAGFTGIFGHKPSFGRVPSYPPSPFYHVAHTGPMARTVADAALMLKVMAGPHEGDRLSLEGTPDDYPAKLTRGIKGKRVAWSPDLGYAQVDPQVAALTAKAAKSFAKLGAKVEEVDPGFGPSLPAFSVFWLSGAAGLLSDSLAQWESQIDPGLVDQVKRGMQFTAVDYVKATSFRHQFWDKVRRFFDKYDLLLTPTLAVLPFKAGVNHPDEGVKPEKDWMEWSPFTYPFNLTHQPAATVPCGFSTEGLPVGLQIVGRRFADTTVLQAAAAFEKAHPWAAARPTL
jgi:aspartyl-tRNA(Asn)/glutamyl-tRNA(Gln) amidotransferase subunit A